MAKATLILRDAAVRRSVIQSIKEPKGIFNFIVQSLESLISATGVSNFSKFISKGNPLTTTMKQKETFAGWWWCYSRIT